MLEKFNQDDTASSGAAGSKASAETTTTPASWQGGGNKYKKGFIGLFARTRCPTIVVEVMFEICQLMKIKFYVRYLALEIFEQFYFKHIREIREAMVRDEPIMWNQTKSKMTKQVFLRMLTCIVLAFKTHSSNARENMTLSRQAVQLLDTAGCHYRMVTLRKSEFRVLETIGYKLFYPLPICCLQVLLSVLCNNLLTIQVSAFYPTLYDVLDLFYYRRSALRAVLTGHQIQQERQQQRRSFRENGSVERTTKRGPG